MASLGIALLRSAPDYGILLKTVRVASYSGASERGAYKRRIGCPTAYFRQCFSQLSQRNHGFLLTNKAQASSHSLLIFRDE
jgi:hypothetical protein